ncbi:ABC transporter substrate-binding protein [Salmonella enterica subsp. enterica]|nr:ABC transporter substrate-binding protein [Salmonella enterica subsp. enterica]MIL09586.1 ABC transporter substrate-binding protein [Salmonella enterica subsp. enterica serovar Enteritidis]
MIAALAAPALFSWRSPASAANKVSVALDWTPNTNHVGLFVARDKGFYRDAGIEVDILPYTDTSATTLVANGVASFGVAGVGLFTQRAAGADLVAVYGVMQTETGRLVVMDNRADIRSPKDLDGKIYGGFGSAWENALIGSIIRHDGGKGEFETVTLGTSAYQALENGKVDFTLEVYTWEGVKAELDGVKQRAFRYADYGVPDEHTSMLCSSKAFLDNNPDAARAFIQATQRGYAFAVDNPREAGDMLIAANKDALTDPALIHASLKTLVDGHYLRSSMGVIGVLDPNKINGMGGYLYKSGILKDAGGKVLTAEPDFTSYFSNAFFARAGE